MPLPCYTVSFSDINTELGLPSTSQISMNDASPRLMATCWAAVPSSTISACQLRSSEKFWGTLWVANGPFNCGEAGNNTNNGYNTPVQNIDTNSYWMCPGSQRPGQAFKTDGTLWGWGPWLQVGNSSVSNANKSSPVQIPGTDWRCIHKGSTQGVVFGLKCDNTLWVWGTQPYIYCVGSCFLPGQSCSPVQIPGSWRDVSTSYQHTIAVKTDNTLWGWGYNINGQVGAGIPANYCRCISSPLQTAGSWCKGYAGQFRSVGVRTDGSWWQWGNLHCGIGFPGTSVVTAYTSSPVTVGSGFCTRDDTFSAQGNYMNVGIPTLGGLAFGIGDTYFLPTTNYTRTARCYWESSGQTAWQVWTDERMTGVRNGSGQVWRIGILQCQAFSTDYNCTCDTCFYRQLPGCWGWATGTRGKFVGIKKQ